MIGSHFCLVLTMLLSMLNNFLLHAVKSTWHITTPPFTPALGQHGESRGTWRGIFGSLGPRGLGLEDDQARSSTSGGADAWALEVTVDACEVYQE